MSHRNSKFHGRNRSGAGAGKKNDNKNEIEITSPLLENFKKYATELDDKHDRYERIVKISRDITIESKRIIFLLHTLDSKKGNAQKVLDEAKQRLDKVFATHFILIAKELHKIDAYQYARAYSAGLQEFIEAYTFYEFLSNQNLSSWTEIQERLTFETKLAEQTVAKPDTTGNDSATEATEVSSANSDSNAVVVSCLVQPTEYILGLADVTGELMRRCITSLGVGDVETCLQCCRVLQHFYTGYVGLDLFRQRDLSRKIFTLRQSVLKSEQVCYNIKVRGSEAALLGAADQATYLSFVGEENEKVDEGFYD